MDIREEAARYYDMNPDAPRDLDFYRDRIPSPASTILELGCGTGRVLIPLVENCAYIHGVDISAAMISLCQEKLVKANIPANRARVEVGDITDLSLDRRFDLITAPYRVFQNLETDAEANGFFDTIRKHLSPGGRCILNVFKPDGDPAVMRQEWANQEEYECWEAFAEAERITCHGKNARMDAHEMVLYPELIYRRYREKDLVEEVTLKIAMRCYYADEVERLITGKGFKILQRWGGYAGEPYDEGPELVIEFGAGS